MGTRFMATKEATIHENVKLGIVKNTERDTPADQPHPAQHLAGGPATPSPRK